jgi:hypothetical protein
MLKDGVPSASLKERRLLDLAASKWSTKVASVFLVRAISVPERAVPRNCANGACGKVFFSAFSSSA